MLGILIDTHTRILIYSFILATVNVACFCFVATFISFINVFTIYISSSTCMDVKERTHICTLSHSCSLCVCFLYHSHSFSLKQHRQERKAFVHKAPSKHATHHQTRHMCTLIHQICKCWIKATHTHTEILQTKWNTKSRSSRIYTIYVYVYMVQSNT